MGVLQAIDRYQINQVLGAGTTGTVYLAHDPKMDREVAIKVLSQDFIHSPKHRERFEREARAIAALRHPNIVELYDFGVAPSGEIYLVEEYIKGQRLDDLCISLAPLPYEVVVAVGVELASALKEAHSHNILHRDLKPQNIFADGGRIVLTDFGIAKKLETDDAGNKRTNVNTEVTGTPGFMAPEQLFEEPLDVRADLFTLGALLYYLSSQKLPYFAKSPQALAKLFLEKQLIPLSGHRPDLPQAFVDLIHKCLETHREVRPDSADGVYQQLRAMLDAKGLGNARDVLRSFQEEPDAFRQRLLTHDETSQNRIPLRASNKIRAHTPMGKHWRFAAILLALGTLAGAAAFGFVKIQKKKSTANAASLLRVSATDPTFIYLNGRELGSTPNFTPTILESGGASLEFVNTKKDHLRQNLVMEPGHSMNVFVDWRSKNVLVKKNALPSQELLPGLPPK